MQGAPRGATGTAFPGVPTRHAPSPAHPPAGTVARRTVAVPVVRDTVTQAVPPVVSRTAKAESLSPRHARADAGRTAPAHADQDATTPAVEDAAADAQVAAATTASADVDPPASAVARHTAFRGARTRVQAGAATRTG